MKKHLKDMQQNLEARQIGQSFCIFTQNIFDYCGLDKEQKRWIFFP